MSLPQVVLADPAARAALATGLDAEPSLRTTRLANFLAHAFGNSAVAILHYGSHAQRSDARPESAHDFFIIVEQYLEAYRSLATVVGMHRRPATAAFLNRILPPNVIRITDGEAVPPLVAKCAILSLRDFRRACSAHAKDHFTQGRLFQHLQLVWTRDAGSRTLVTDTLLEARARTFEWGRAYLPTRFDVDMYCRVLLETSFAAEIRPEGLERIDALLAAQKGTLGPAYAGLLRSLADNRILLCDGKVYTEAHPPGVWPKFRAAMYFRRSKLRATLRWLKYVALYDDWLEYILQKVARRSGQTVELTPRERRWPLIFLWPKAIRFLRSRPQRRT